MSLPLVLRPDKPNDPAIDSVTLGTDRVPDAASVTLEENRCKYLLKLEKAV
jgi:hypothetical protein